MRLLGVHVSGWESGAEQMELLGEERHERWKGALAAADRMRDRFDTVDVSALDRFRGEQKDLP